MTKLTKVAARGGPGPGPKAAHLDGLALLRLPRVPPAMGTCSGYANCSGGSVVRIDAGGGENSRIAQHFFDFCMNLHTLTRLERLTFLQDVGEAQPCMVKFQQKFGGENPESVSDSKFNEI